MRPGAQGDAEYLTTIFAVICAYRPVYPPRPNHSGERIEATIVSLNFCLDRYVVMIDAIEELGHQLIIHQRPGSLSLCVIFCHCAQLRCASCIGLQLIAHAWLNTAQIKHVRSEADGQETNELRTSNFSLPESMSKLKHGRNTKHPADPPRRNSNASKRNRTAQ
jgi:hypothetical protein